MLLCIITYDISCDRRRKRISDLLEGYGSRVQYSMLIDKKFDQLCQRLRKLVKDGDRVRFYPLSSHTLGQVIIRGSRL